MKVKEKKQPTLGIAMLPIVLAIILLIWGVGILKANAAVILLMISMFVTVAQHICPRIYMG